jgi:predicted transcriptional regulator
MSFRLVLELRGYFDQLATKTCYTENCYKAFAIMVHNDVFQPYAIVRVLY